jgi:hypothetical protein
MNERQPDHTDSEQQYEAVRAGDGEFVIYDRSNKTAWVQSNYTVDVRQ